VVRRYHLIIDLEVDVLDDQGDLEVLVELLFGCVRNDVLLGRLPAWRGSATWLRTT
jgi:hypothetical protein